MSGPGSGDDRVDAEAELDAQAEWGEGFQDRALRRVLAWMDKTRDRLASLETDRATARTAIQDLRARVAALEQKVP